LINLTSRVIDYYRKEINTLEERLKNPNLTNIEKKMAKINLKNCEQVLISKEEELKRLIEKTNPSLKKSF